MRKKLLGSPDSHINIAPMVLNDLVADRQTNPPLLLVVKKGVNISSKYCAGIPGRVVTSICAKGSLSGFMKERVLTGSFRTG
jgi:hypothetical protein